MRWLFVILLVGYLGWYQYAFASQENIAAVTSSAKLKYEPSGSNSWFPYYIHSSDRKGIVPELIELILQQANIKGQEVALPAARTNLALDNGAIDFDLINPKWLPEGTPVERYAFSAPIIPVKEYYIALSITDMSPISEMFEQEKPLKIGTVLGYYYHNDNQFQRVDFSSEKNLILALQQKRVKYAICDDVTAHYWAKVLSVPIAIGPIHSDGFLHIRFRKDLASIVPKINQAIAKLKGSGALEKVVNSYL